VRLCSEAFRLSNSTYWIKIKLPELFIFVCHFLLFVEVMFNLPSADLI
jgi:hypothetical protein